MKNTSKKALCLTVILVLPLNSLAQSVQDNCEAVERAAVSGRDQANSRISSIEQVVNRQAQSARSCLERFGDAASRQSMLIGPFDLAPLRNALMDQACNMIQGSTQAVTSQLPTMPTLPGGNTSQGARGITNPSTTRPGIWDRLACSVAGNC